MHPLGLGQQILTKARRGYTKHLTESHIEELVTHGLLLANKIGIRWKHLDNYVLLKTEEPVLNRATQPQFEKIDAHVFRRAKRMQAGASEDTDTIGESPATPLLELDAPPLAVGEKNARLCAKSTCILSREDEQGERVLDVKDNEGKTTMRMKNVGELRKWKRGSRMY